MDTIIYGFRPFYTGGQPVIDDLKNSGFTTVIQASVFVLPEGDLVFHGHDLCDTIIKDGQYKGRSEWPGLLYDLKKSPTSVNRLLFTLASGDGEFHGTYRNIKSLIKKQGTGKNSILYKNFKALKDAIPAIDGIDLDYEGEENGIYYRTPIIKFSPMLHTLGYEVTFCPFQKPCFWVDCLHTLNSETPGLVTRFHVQCYTGCYPQPKTWIKHIQKKMGSCFDAQGFVFPGICCRHGDYCKNGLCPEGISTKFAAWKEDGIQGGFIWLYDNIQRCNAYNQHQKRKHQTPLCSGSMDTQTYAQAILKGLK